MSSDTSPSAAGRTRYARTDGYYRTHPLDGDRFPCTCEHACVLPCDGACGCVACTVARLDGRESVAFARR